MDSLHIPVFEHSNYINLYSARCSPLLKKDCRNRDSPFVYGVFQSSLASCSF